MKFYNKTKCPDSILRPLLAAAGKSVGARTVGVVVKVTQGRNMSSKGCVYSMPLVYCWHLKNMKRRRNSDNNNLGKLIQTDGGWIEITLPKLKRPEVMKCFFLADGITLAQNFYKTAQHEWAHIKDNQQRITPRTPKTPSGRRIAWKERPCEIYAENQVAEAKPRNIDDYLLALALYFEENQPKD